MVGETFKKFMEDHQLNYGILTVTTTRTLKVYENMVEFDSTGGAFTCTLPKAAEAQGKYFTFRLAVDGGDVTLAHGGDSLNWTNIVFNDAGDKSMLYCDGRMWHQLNVGTA